jgi:hypothetical protein
MCPEMTCTKPLCLAQEGTFGHTGLTHSALHPAITHGHNRHDNQ